MTTTPLPPLPEIDDAQCIPYQSVRYVAGFTKDFVKQYAQAYAQQARADLEAENQRLRVFVMQVLKGCLTGRIKSPPIVIEDLEATDLKLISLGDAARAALESKP